MTRDGPGLLYRDIARGKDDQVAAVVEALSTISPDVVALWGIDWDYDGRAVEALKAVLAQAGLDLPHHFANQPNRGIPTGFDLNGDGRLGDPEDAQSFGEFTGQNGLAVLSRWPIGEGAQDFTAMLWRDLPGALLPWPGQPEGSEEVLRLSSTAHWLLPIATDGHGTVWLGTFAAGAPVFDGPEDRNGRRNHDEIALWSSLLGGRLDVPAPEGLVIAGHANLDPTRGEGRREAIQTLSADEQLQDPHGPDTITVDWQRDDLEPMRVSYVLPSVTWEIMDAGVLRVENASRHAVVWVDLVRRQAHR